MTSINSASVGDPARFRPFAELARGLAALPPAPTDRGRVELLVRRGEQGARELPEQVRLTPEAGLPGDAWGRDPKRLSEAQLAVMQRDVAELIAHGQSLELFGDGLFVTLDLSADNLPAGSRLRVGRALLELTPQPHNGCAKFRSRFGDDALRFVGEKRLRRRNLRGVYLRVIEPGDVSIGDMVEVVSRPPRAL